jgi:LuxR family quorum sensing-dependent transcriptional regulator
MRESQHWGIRALEFVDAVEVAQSSSEVLCLFSQAVGQAGFSAYVMCGLPDAHTSFPNRMIADGWPRGWSELYLKENLAKNDPVERHCLRTVEPFEWREAPYAGDNMAAKAVMDRACDFGMVKGFCVPIHYGDGSGAAVSFAGEQPDLDRGTRPALHLMALYAHHRIRSLLRPTPLHADRVLSAREREVVLWATTGKTNWEIGMILNISERTVHAHMQSAARKLNAVNRTSTIVNALRAGEITL